MIIDVCRVARGPPPSLLRRPLRVKQAAVGLLRAPDHDLINRKKPLGQLAVDVDGPYCNQVVLGRRARIHVVDAPQRVRNAVRGAQNN